MVGLVILAAPIHWAFSVMLVSTLFGAAAALSLPMLGGATVLVPSLFLPFFALRMFMAAGEGYFLAALQPPRAGFWLLLLTAFGLLTAIFFPRLFQGVTETMTVERVANGRNFITLTPLRFSSNNITQSVYAIGGVVAFAAAFSYFRQTGTPRHLVAAIVLLAAMNIIFAIIDVATYFTRTEQFMSIFRTANYALLTGSEKGGLKRISGTFPEASTFASYALVLFAATASLWLDRMRSWTTGPLAALSLAALLLSTSATALIGVIAVVPFLWLRALVTGLWKPAMARPTFLVVVVAVVPLLALILLVLFPQVAESLNDFIDEMLLSKAGSQSGRERTLWNAMAYQTFLDTYGFGAGLGSARASSYILVLLSNVGVLGFLLFSIFVVAVLRAQPATMPGSVGDELLCVARACKAGVLAMIVPAAISGTVYDMSAMFYLLTGSLAAFVVPASAAGRVAWRRPSRQAGAVEAVS
ncbi:hypothetical protein GCM10007920_38070 [Ciceribacter naphthalenivorans]|uniref:Uncharacterized protein n=2 Tax=Alphaproteobacteria TaxID=28211 RepID=A0A512HN61_9HYPH|nr:hypothetical protein RNA01_38010 [Ciceribacter naphthalenivorans]GLR24013.1 hypothetical protein GCM10007920_38070 [Ciceribacter naphthalenivorans]GLT06869.1 hypothetical protein GCM10007926_38070 [Sphingomonas psychrolutea]